MRSCWNFVGRSATDAGASEPRRTYCMMGNRSEPKRCWLRRETCPKKIIHPIVGNETVRKLIKLEGFLTVQPTWVATVNRNLVLDMMRGEIRHGFICHQSGFLKKHILPTQKTKQIRKNIQLKKGVRRGFAILMDASGHGQHRRVTKSDVVSSEREGAPQFGLPDAATERE